MHITLAQAAEQCGVNRSTLLRAVKAGRISGTRDEGGNWTVDPAEAFRVFPPKQPPQQAKADAATDALVAHLQRALDDLRHDRDHWREIAQRLALPVPKQEPQPAQAEPQQRDAAVMPESTTPWRRFLRWRKAG